MEPVVERCTFCRRFIIPYSSNLQETEPTYPMCEDCLREGKDYYDSGVAVKKQKEEDDDIHRWLGS
jgi:hypothetical protein